MTGRGRRPRESLTREDKTLWAHVVRSVAPMAGREAFALDLPPPPAVTAPVSPAPPPAPPGKLPKAPAPPPLAPLDRRLRQRLSRGQRAVDGVIDLHGMRQAEAHSALIGFIVRAQREGRSVVLVITGKGGAGVDDRSDTGQGRGVLKRMAPHWLGDPVLRRCIVGFEDAARDHGGAGALYVRIRKAKPQ